MKNFSWQEITLFVFVFIIGFPSLFVAWMIIDDGVSILMAQKISDLLSSFNFSGFWDLFLEKESGRFRPAYWLFHWFAWLLVGKNPLFHHLIHVAISATTVFLIFSIIKILTFSKSAAFLGSLLFLLTFLNIENWYRLGPQEPLLVFYLAVSLYFLVRNISLIQGPEKKMSKRNLLFSILPLIPAYFTKETSLALLPFGVFLPLGAAFIKERARRELWLKNSGYFLLANLILTMSSLAVIIFIRSEGYYSSYYLVSLSNFINHGRGYLGAIGKSFGPFALIFLFSFLLFSFLGVRKREFTLTHFFQIAFIIGFLSFFAIQLPWAFVLGRYLEPALFFLVIVCGLEAARLLRAIKPNLKLKAQFVFFDSQIKMIVPFSYLRDFGLFLVFMGFVFTNGPPIFNYISGIVVGTQETRKILAFVANEAPRNGRVFLNLRQDEATFELVFESKLHLDLFYDRPDLTVDYLTQIRDLKEGDLIVTAFASENFLAYPQKDLAKMRGLKTIKILQHKIPSLSFYPRGLKRVLGFILIREPRPRRGDLYNLAISETQWRVDKVVQTKDKIEER